MSLVIIDNFDGDHGEWVLDTAEQYYTGDIHTVDLGDSHVSRDLIEDKLDFVYEQIQDEWEDVSAVNLSFGGGMTEDFTWAESNGFENHIQPLFVEGVDVIFPSGNYGRQNYLGVSKIASSPFSWCVGATDENGITDYTQWDPLLTDAFANGHNDTYDVDGTSFSAPVISAVIAETREMYDLSIPDFRTVFEATADYNIGADSVYGEGWQNFVYQEIDVDSLLGIGGKVKITEKQWADSAYEIFCGRQPDETGLEYWTERFEFGDKTLEDFIKSAEAHDDLMADNVPVFERVQAHYHLLLDREADMPGLEYWVDEWTSENYTNWHDFADDFIAAGEDEQIQFQGIVENFFNEINSIGG